MDRLTSYGTPLGVAFQIRDDLLGTFGRPEELGKPVGADLRAGKRTALLELALARAKGPDRARLEEVVGRRDASEAEVTRACEVIEALGVRRECQEQIERLTKEALAALDDSAFLPEGLTFLRGIASMLASRDR
jgi:geranylgeranyl diphosphate synthase type I